MARVYRELERRFPTVDFVRAFMDPIMKRRLSPDQRLRKAMFDPLPARAANERLVAFLGSDFALDADCEVRSTLRAAGLALAELQGCATYDQYLDLARAGTFVATYPNAAFGVERLARRLGRRYLYLPASFSYEEIRSHHEALKDALGTPMPDVAREVERCEEALARARDAVAGVPVAIDASLHPRPLGLARLLVEHGFAVAEVYLDAVSPEEGDALAWLRSHAPSLELSSVVLPELRVAPRVREREPLALGQKAAWFTGTSHFVNVVEGGGLWGFAGIRRLAALMVEALEVERDARDLVPRKGLGCASCF